MSKIIAEHERISVRAVWVGEPGNEPEIIFVSQNKATTQYDGGDTEKWEQLCSSWRTILAATGYSFDPVKDVPVFIFSIGLETSNIRSIRFDVYYDMPGALQVFAYSIDGPALDDVSVAGSLILKGKPVWVNVPVSVPEVEAALNSVFPRYPIDAPEIIRNPRDVIGGIELSRIVVRASYSGKNPYPQQPRIEFTGYFMADGDEALPSLLFGFEKSWFDALSLTGQAKRPGDPVLIHRFSASGVGSNDPWIEDFNFQVGYKMPSGVFVGLYAIYGHSVAKLMGHNRSRSIAVPVSIGAVIDGLKREKIWDWDQSGVIATGPVEPMSREAFVAAATPDEYEKAPVEESEEIEPKWWSAELEGFEGKDLESIHHLLLRIVANDQSEPARTAVSAMIASFRRALESTDASAAAAAAVKNGDPDELFKYLPPTDGPQLDWGHGGPVIGEAPATPLKLADAEPDAETEDDGVPTLDDVTGEEELTSEMQSAVDAFRAADSEPEETFESFSPVRVIKVYAPEAEAARPDRRKKGEPGGRGEIWSKNFREQYRIRFGLPPQSDPNDRPGNSMDDIVDPPLAILFNPDPAFQPRPGRKGFLNQLPRSTRSFHGGGVWTKEERMDYLAMQARHRDFADKIRSGEVSCIVAWSDKEQRALDRFTPVLKSDMTLEEFVEAAAPPEAFISLVDYRLHGINAGEEGFDEVAYRAAADAASFGMTVRGTGSFTADTIEAIRDRLNYNRSGLPVNPCDFAAVTDIIADSLKREDARKEKIEQRKRMIEHTRLDDSIPFASGVFTESVPAPFKTVITKIINGTGSGYSPRWSISWPLAVELNGGGDIRFEPFNGALAVEFKGSSISCELTGVLRETGPDEVAVSMKELSWIREASTLSMNLRPDGKHSIHVGPRRPIESTDPHPDVKLVNEQEVDQKWRATWQQIGDMRAYRPTVLLPTNHLFALHITGNSGTRHAVEPRFRRDANDTEWELTARQIEKIMNDPDSFPGDESDRNPEKGVKPEVDVKPEVVEDVAAVIGGDPFDAADKTGVSADRNFPPIDGQARFPLSGSFRGYRSRTSLPWRRGGALGTDGVLRMGVNDPVPPELLVSDGEVAPPEELPPLPPQVPPVKNDPEEIARLHHIINAGSYRDHLKRISGKSGIPDVRRDVAPDEWDRVDLNRVSIVVADKYYNRNNSSDLPKQIGSLHADASDSGDAWTRSSGIARGVVTRSGGKVPEQRVFLFTGFNVSIGRDIEFTVWYRLESGESVALYSIDRALVKELQCGNTRLYEMIGVVVLKGAVSFHLRSRFEADRKIPPRYNDAVELVDPAKPWTPESIDLSKIKVDTTGWAKTWYGVPDPFNVGYRLEVEDVEWYRGNADISIKASDESMAGSVFPLIVRSHGAEGSSGVATIGRGVVIEMVPDKGITTGNQSWSGRSIHRFAVSYGDHPLGMLQGVVVRRADKTVVLFISAKTVADILNGSGASDGE